MLFRLEIEPKRLLSLFSVVRNNPCQSKSDRSEIMLTLCFLKDRLMFNGT